MSLRFSHLHVLGIRSITISHDSLCKQWSYRYRCKVYVLERNQPFRGDGGYETEAINSALKALNRYREKLGIFKLKAPYMALVDRTEYEHYNTDAPNWSDETKCSYSISTYNKVQTFLQNVYKLAKIRVSDGIFKHMER